MITRERLKELWKNHAMVYLADHITCGVIYWPVRGLYLKKDIIDDVEYLFETKEECKWYAEFGNIKRIDTLSLPIWEKFKEISYWIDFSVGYTTYSLGKESNKIVIISYYNDMEFAHTHKIFCEDLNEENYIKACELCKKLFLGEEEC